MIHQETNPQLTTQSFIWMTQTTVIEKASFLLFDAYLVKEFWGEATNTEVYL